MKGSLKRLLGSKPTPAASRQTPPLVEPAEHARRIERACFIAGLHRSGTTLVEQMIAAACEVTVLAANVPENEGQHLQDVVPAANRHGGAGRFAFAPDMHTPPAAGTEIRRQRDRLLACWTPWMEGDASLLVEKSPPNLVRIPWLRSIFEDTKFLIVTRDPRVTALATRKWAKTSLEELVYHWHVAHDAAHQAMGPDCHHLRYEDLCADPEAALSAAIDALALPRRATPRPLPERFRDIRNSNDTYLSTLEPRRWGRGSWDDFGYDLGS